jgi:hypothetical protein
MSHAKHEEIYRVPGLWQVVGAFGAAGKECPKGMRFLPLDEYQDADFNSAGLFHD